MGGRQGPHGYDMSSLSRELRAVARNLEKLAEELEARAANDGAPAEPERPLSEIDMARARKALRKAGFRL
jgi:hypothetical protein